MKKIKYLLLILICLFTCRVKADPGPPAIISYKAMITNQNGAQCYDYDGKKQDIIIPYKTVFEIYEDIYDKYVFVKNDKYECSIKASDLGVVNKEFDLNNEQVEKIEPVKAVILAKGGLNMRKGPATFYERITTIPEKAMVTLKYNAGTYWYYAEYKGKSGWITGVNYYFGMDRKEVLVSTYSVEIFNKNRKVIGQIPANTEITSYVEVIYPSGREDGFSYYVNYSGIEGYVKGSLFKKINPEGKIRLLDDTEYFDENFDTKKLNKGYEFTYDLRRDLGDGYEFHDKEKNIYICLHNFIDNFEYIKEGKPEIKKSGYIEEGIFSKIIDDPEAEEVNDETVVNQDEIIKKVSNSDKKITKQEIIIISLLAGIFLAITTLVTIKLINMKKGDQNEKN